jgi:hypothetical protein
LLCPERAPLLIYYRDAVRRDSECVHDLVEAIRLEIYANIEFLRRRVREAWDAAEQARLALTRTKAITFVTGLTSRLPNLRLFESASAGAPSKD